MKFEIVSQQGDYHIFLPLGSIQTEAKEEKPLSNLTPQANYDSGDCVCCQMNKSTHRILSCGHTCLCAPCFLILETSEHPYCPLCRAPMREITPLPVIEKQETFKTKSEC